MRIEGIRAEELPRWVPGRVVLASDPLNWQGIKLRSYRYDPLDVEVPALQDFMIVAYRKGPTAMDRRFDGRWRHEDLVPGDVSLLTRSKQSHWHWTADIEVVHVYLSIQLMQQVCEEVYERPIAAVHLRDVLKTQDPILFAGAMSIAREVANGALGGELYVDAVARQLCIHTLRNYSNVSFFEPSNGSGLGLAQERRLRDYIEANLGEILTNDRLASVAACPTHHLLRHFKARFGLPPHSYVLARRLERARQLLRETTLPSPEIASQTGFSYQSHLTRLFKRRYGVTPAAFRRTEA